MLQLSVYDVRCEYGSEQLGLDVTQPRFSWKLGAMARDVMQAAYQLQVARDSSFRQLDWDSGMVQGSQAIQVAYEGAELVARTRYYYRVRVWSNTGEMSVWSEPSWWETGLMSSDAWLAQWITAPVLDAPDSVHYLRGSFHARPKLRQARIYATSLGLYRLYVNGCPLKEQLFTPGWTSYRHRLQYQAYDVTAMLGEGEQAIGCMLADGWYKGALTGSYKRNVFGERKALLLQLYMVYEDGQEQWLCTDGSWRYSPGPLTFSSLYDGERYDARLEQPGWAEAGFDDSGWRHVELLQHEKNRIIAQEGPPVRVMERLQPVNLLNTPKGETVLDMGQNMTGGMRFKVNAPAGTQVRLRHAEVLDREGSFYTENLRSAKQEIVYTCKGGGLEQFEPYFTFQGFRYVKIEGLTDVDPANFTGLVIYSEMKPAGSFESSEPLLNQLHQNIVWSQRGNFLDVPTDCPQRDERLGWTGDAHIFLRAASYLTEVGPFYSKWLHDLKADQLEDGGVPSVVPSMLEKHSSAGWGDAAVICPWTLYKVYGDRRLLEDQYESMKAWVDYMERQGDHPELYNTGFHFGDWLALDAKENSYTGSTPKDFIGSAFFAYSASLLAKAAATLGRRQDAVYYAELHERVKRQFQREFVTPSGRLAAPTQTAHVLALMFDLMQEAHRERVKQDLRKLLIDKQGLASLTTGFLGTPYLCHVLSASGMNDVAYQLVLRKEYPSWLYAVGKGATTVWEHWDGIKGDGSLWSKHMNSFNHYAYGAIADWLYKVAAGIDTEEGQPGYKGIRIAPQPDERLSEVKATYHSIHGTIESHWHRGKDGGMTVRVCVPPNTTAIVVLPNAAHEPVKESGLAPEKAAGIHKVVRQGKDVALSIGSGQYEFEYRLPLSLTEDNTIQAGADRIPVQQ